MQMAQKERKWLWKLTNDKCDMNNKKPEKTGILLLTITKQLTCEIVI